MIVLQGDIQGNKLAPSPYRVDRLSTLDQLDALEKDWSEFVEDIPDVSIFQTWEWIRTWWLNFDQNRQLWLLTARDEQGTLQGIAPLMREEYKKGGFKLGMLSFVGSGRVCPTRLKILARTLDREGLFRAFLSFLLDHSDQWDILRISHVVEDSVDDNLLKAAGGRIRIGAKLASLYIPLPDSWESYLKIVSRKFRRDIITSRSKLEGDYPGLGNFAQITNSMQLDSVMHKLEELIRFRCHSKGLPTDWDDPGFTRFHRTISSLALNRGWLDLSTLSIGDQIIAVLYNFRFKNCVYGYNMGYELDWSRYSPGRLMIAYSIQAAIQNASREYDMGRGDAEYKYSWTDHVRVENEILFGNKWSGKLWITLGNIERNLRIKIKHFLVAHNQ